QQFVEKPGRDVRVLLAGGEPVAAMSRSADHWITNAAAGAETEAFALDDEAAALAKAASDAVGGGLLGVDLMETGVDAAGNATGYTVHEVNHTVEFQALNGAVDVDVPAAVVDWLETVPEQGAKTEVEA
ncbi:MAG: lysine biosynthesis protein LysX, partial [Halolamina sp.]